MADSFMQHLLSRYPNEDEQIKEFNTHIFNCYLLHLKTMKVPPQCPLGAEHNPSEKASKHSTNEEEEPLWSICSIINRFEREVIDIENNVFQEYCSNCVLRAGWGGMCTQKHNGSVPWYRHPLYQHDCRITLLYCNIHMSYEWQCSLVQMAAISLSLVLKTDHSGSSPLIGRTLCSILQWGSSITRIALEFTSKGLNGILAWYSFG
ncbi:hypothetical protein HAX54_000338 [Datura stramonium]|uniref:Uncharacterized protein n=1 Tax=Datura stramonium TaxID=4076 RepID=A0ABS8T1X6_DATST|nr:hypothetical protein [Datura stramonium]